MAGVTTEVPSPCFYFINRLIPNKKKRGGRQQAGEGNRVEQRAAGVTWKVNQGQGDQGHRRQRLVDSVQGELVEVVLALVNERQQDVPQEDITIEEEEEEEADEDRAPPGGEEEQRDLLHVAGGGQDPKVNRVEAQTAGQLQQQGLGLGAVAADQDLQGATKIKILWSN